ncbi:hypothetical protein Sru01_54840 [Sphaerisporangium rufum]|uniref:Antigen 84 n=1 Tax=Sphaerisporangium rufum TaxID=1381558 RepID=A0A919V376_9ACTN|nr:DivIVA domain-containing protein [Sphaerisporangium rufum]GII80502.1 hypothetical protein Sru01_54840 [Sphaerisporangium rufum]
MNRFPRVLAVRTGYDPDQVDALIQRIEATLGRGVQTGEPITADEIRGARFATRLGGYNELAVDYALDAFVVAVEIHAARRTPDPAAPAVPEPRRSSSAAPQAMPPQVTAPKAMPPQAASTQVTPPQAAPVPAVAEDDEAPTWPGAAGAPDVAEIEGYGGSAGSGPAAGTGTTVPGEPGRHVRAAGPAAGGPPAAHDVQPGDDVRLGGGARPGEGARAVDGAWPGEERAGEGAWPGEERAGESVGSGGEVSRPAEFAAEDGPVAGALREAWLESQAVRVERVAFRPGRLGAGYDEDQVDDFLDRIVATLRGTTDRPVTAEQVRRATFSTVVFKTGYAVAQVDAFLAEIADVLDGGRGADPADGHDSPVTSTARS